MNETITATVYHDTRSKNKDGESPVKIRIYGGGEEKFYFVFYNKAKLRLTPKDFELAYKSSKPKGIYNEWNIAISECRNRAKKIITELTPFTHPAFEKRYMGKLKRATEVIGMYEEVMRAKEKNGDIGTFENYKQSLASIKRYYQYRKGSTAPVEKIEFTAITPDFLKGYTKYMTDVEIIDGGKVVKKKASITTVGIYLRPLRAIFNKAISDRLIIEENYPFGKGEQRHMIPTGKKAKKALQMAQVKALYEVDLSGNPYQFEARAYFFLSYIGNGMNMADIANLKYKNFTQKSFSFIRTKTSKTSADPILVQVPLHEYVKGMVTQYGNKDKKPDNYVFPIYQHGMSDTEKKVACKNFTRKINQHLKPVAKQLDFPADFSTIWARHSFSTIAIQKGAKMEYVKDALGHMNIKTTHNYFQGFEDNHRHQLNNLLLDFSGVK